MIKFSKKLLARMKQKYIGLFKEFTDVFPWSYEYLKSYETEIIQHKIAIKENINPLNRNCTE